jgi:hypothetical protein
MFELSFHFKYFAWRSSPVPSDDHRRNANAVPLRITQNVSFLNWNETDPPCFLYVAQISCVIFGPDKWRYVGYCFVDTYFDARGDARESVQDYHEESLGEGGMRADPFTYGNKEAVRLHEDPRIYYLLALRFRITQIKNEWEKIVLKVTESIQEYEQVGNISLSLPWET